MLFIEGFKNAEEIGKRIVELFDLSKFVFFNIYFIHKIIFFYFLVNFYHPNDTTTGA